MTLHTEIPGNPGELRTVAAWLRDTLGEGLDRTIDALRASATPDAGWRGEAADAFRARTTDLRTRADDLHRAITTGASALDRFATALADAQARVADIRSGALTAGLTVTPTAILAPLVVPVRPVAGTLPQADYDRALRQYTLTSARWTAYHRAETQLGTVSTDLTAALTALETAEQSSTSVVVPTLDMLLGGTIGALTDLHVGALRGWADLLLEQSARLRANTQLPGAALNPNLFYRDLDDAAALAARSAAVSDDALRAARIGRAAGWAAGGVLTGVSIWMDVQQGESVAQAATSNVVGFGASIAAGAAIGTLIPVPVVGTVAGAVVGGVVGIFTSGMVDGLFENGPDVGAAVSQGWEDLKDTGEAIGDAVGTAAGWVGDGLSNAWDSIFG